MAKVTFENFELKKFKVVDKSGSISYYDRGSESLELINAELKNKLHHDLTDKLQVLQELMARRLGLLDVTDAAKEQFKKNPDVLEFMMKQEEQQIARCTVTGYVISGSDDKKVIQITGSMGGDSYGSVGLATPITKVRQETLGYEEQLVKACEEVTKEVFMHAFKNKKAAEPTDNQTTILDDDQQQE